MSSDTHPVVMITGAAGTLGRAVTEAFASRGARLALLDRYPEASVQADRLELPCDLRSAEEVRSAVQRILERFGRIDVLCNLAGGFRMGEAVHETSLDTWSGMFDLNLRSVVHTAQAVVPPMLAAGKGWIVNVGAATAARGGARMGAYAASKSAVARLTESMSAELRERGIHVNCVLPSILDTPPNRADMPDADPSRWVAPGDLAQVIVFLCSDGARAIHGASVPVTGLV